MLYMAIDQHRKHLTVNIRNESGEIVLRRQVSTAWERVMAFFEDLQGRSEREGGYVACVEVCGFNDWLLRALEWYGCQQIVLVQPEDRDRRKTDRRDAQRLGELLWINRSRLASSERLQGLRRVMIPKEEQKQDRRLTALRQETGRQRTRVINQVKGILRRNNLEQECPAKGIATGKARFWLRSVSLSAMDRAEMNLLLARWDLLDRQRLELDEAIIERVSWDADARQLMTVPGVGAYGSLAILSRITPIDRFPRARSLANFLGLTPSSRNSGEATKRLGSITKQGSAMVRFLLGQIVLHVLHRDPRMREWFRAVKRRRGAKVARVAVMRRVAGIVWHVLRKGERYHLDVDPHKHKAGKKRLSDAEADAVKEEVQRSLKCSPKNKERLAQTSSRS